MSPLFIAVTVVAAIVLFAGQRWMDAHQPPKRDPELALRPPSLSSESGREFVETVLTASDAESTHWPPGDVQAARVELRRAYGLAPGRNSLVKWYDRGDVERVTKQVLDARLRFTNELRRMEAIAIRPGICHLCGRPSSMTYPFGLARIRHVERDWSATVVSVGLSAIVGALWGPVMVFGPRKEQSGNLLRLQLQVCPECDRARKGRLRLGKVRAAHYSHHPWWDAAHQLGFTTLVSEAELARWHQPGE